MHITAYDNRMESRIEAWTQPAGVEEAPCLGVTSGRNDQGTRNGSLTVGDVREMINLGRLHGFSYNPGRLCVPHGFSLSLSGSQQCLEIAGIPVEYHEDLLRQAGRGAVLLFDDDGHSVGAIDVRWSLPQIPDHRVVPGFFPDYEAYRRAEGGIE